MANPAPKTELALGSIVAGTYKLTGMLGKGGMGSVWAAEHTRLPGKRVAIKVLHAEVADDAEALVRFRREAEIASRLGHQNIVDVLDFNTLEDGAPYLVLEYLEGESLAARLLRGPMPFDHVSQFVRQIGSALDAAHAENIIHRDLKPQNVFLCPRQTTGFFTEEAKVLDFGISKIRGSNTVKTQDHTMLGTPQYMAPEQATGNHDAVDGRTDVFALGAMVYEMLSGQPAFGGHTIPEVVFKVVYESPRDIRELVPTVTPDAAAAVHKALEKKSEDRFDDVQSFVLALTGSPITTLRRGAVVTTGDSGAEGTAATATPASLKKSDAGLANAATQTGNPLAAMANFGVASTNAGANAAVTPAGTVDPASTGREAFAATVGSASQPVPDVLTTDKPKAKGSKRGIAMTVAGLLFSGAIITFLVVRPGGGSDDPGEGDKSAASQTKTDDKDMGVKAKPDQPKPDPVEVVDNKPDPTKKPDPIKDPPKKDPRTAGPTKKDPQKDSRVAKKKVPPKNKRHGFVAKPHKPPVKKLDPRVASLLKQARAAFSSGSYRRARHLANRAMNAGGGKLSAAYAIIAKAYCKEQNLGMARANLRNVRGRTKYQVKAYCKRNGVEIID